MKSTTPAAMKVVFATGMLLVAANSLPAATRTWTGDGGNDLWSNPNNWSPAGVPQDGDDLNFFLQVCPYPNPCVPITVVNDLNNLRAGRLRFGDPYVGNGAYLKEYIVNGNPLRLTGRVTVGCYCGDDSPLVKVTFNCPLVLESDPRFDVAYGGWDTIGWQGRENRLLLNGAVNLNGHDLDILLGQNLSDSRSRVDISGTISGAGNIYIHAGRSCTAEFNGAADNTFTGTLTFDGGAADHRFVLNKTSGAVTHGRLVIDGYCYWNRPEQLGNEATVQINDYSRARLQGHNETILNLEMAPGAAANSGAFLDTEGGALVVLNRITSQSGFDPPAIAGRLDLAQDLICDVNGTNFYGLDLQAVVSGAGALVKAGNAALRLSGNNTFTGSVRVGQGTVEAAHTGAFGRAADRVLLVAGTVRLNNVVIPDEILVVQQDGGTLFTLGAAGWTGPIRLTQPGVDLTVYGENFTVSGDITGTGGLVLLGNSITFAGDYDNTFSGATRVGCERLQLNKPPGVRAVSGPLIIGADVPEQHEVRWLNHGQLPPDANVTLHQSGLLSLNDFAETLANLTFNGGHVNLASDSVLQLFGTVTANPSSATALIDGATGLGSFFLSGMRTFNVADGTVAGPDLRIDARIAGGIGGGGMTKIGDGTLALGGNNNFSGAVIISNGIVRADHNNALGTTSAGTTVHEGATLFLANAADLVREPVILNGAGFGGTNGALLASGAVTLSNNVVLAGPSTIRVDSPWQLKIDGVISGAGPLTKIGSGTLTLAGTANNTFSGDTLVNAGTLQLDKSDFVQAVPGNLVIGSGGFFATPATVRHFSQDQIWAGVTVNAGSLLDVNGYEEYLLTLTLNGGGDVQTGGGLLTLLAGNSLGVDPGPTGNNTATISGRLGLRVGNHQISVGGFNLPPPGGAPELDIPATVEFVDGLANLHKHGAGTMRLRGANTFTGTLIVNDGRVIAAHNSALGTTQASTLVQTNGALALDGGITTGEFLILDSVASPALVSSSGSNVVNNGINLLRPDNGIEVQPANGYLQVLGRVGSSGGLTKLGPGTLQFWGATSNTYGGLTTVSAGVLQAGRSNAVSIPGDAIIGDDSTTNTTATLRLLRDTQLKRAASVTVNASGLLDLSPLPGWPAPQPTLRRLRGEGRVNTASLTSLSISNDVDSLFAGSIAGYGALNKYGPATFQLTGESLFFGWTTVWEGYYKMHGRATNSPVVVKPGATLNGDGALGDVSVETNGLVQPVTSVRGRFGGDLEMASAWFDPGARLALNLLGSSPTGTNESLFVNGNVNLNGAELTLSRSYAPREGEVITLIHKTTPGAISGAFNSYTQGAVRALGGVPVLVSYTGGDGNDLTLTVTNLALALAGAWVESGNGNGLVDPDECDLVWIALTNRRNSPLTITSATLRSATPHALVTMAQPSYPDFAARSVRTNLTPFQVRTLTNLPCGLPVPLELQVSVVGEGTFSIPFTLAGGTNCTTGGGGCESCIVVSGAFTTDTPTLPERFYFTTGPSTCLPPKPCPGTDPGANLPPARYLTHSFTNSTTNELCITVQLHYACANPPLNALGAAAYLGAFDPGDLCANYLGDGGAYTPLGQQPFSFRVPAGSNFVVVLSEQATNLVCPDYALELFGLPCPPPTLHIVQEAAPGGVRLHWSTAYPEWRLFATPTLTGPVPIPYPNTNALTAVVNGRYSQTDFPASSNRFYRLLKP